MGQATFGKKGRLVPILKKIFNAFLWFLPSSGHFKKLGFSTHTLWSDFYFYKGHERGHYELFVFQSLSRENPYFFKELAEFLPEASVLVIKFKQESPVLKERLVKLLDKEFDRLIVKQDLIYASSKELEIYQASFSEILHKIVLALELD